MFHFFFNFKVINNTPKLIKKLTEELSALPFVINYTEEIWNGKKMISHFYQELGELSEDMVLSVVFNKNQKKLFLLKHAESNLFYALVDANDELEFYYPLDPENQKFTYNKQNNTLTFQNKDATYMLYENKNSIGIKINTKGKVYNWQGDITTKEGNLSDIRNNILENVIIK